MQAIAAADLMRALDRDVAEREYLQQRLDAGRITRDDYDVCIAVQDEWLAYLGRMPVYIPRAHKAHEGVGC